MLQAWNNVTTTVTYSDYTRHFSLNINDILSLFNDLAMLWLTKTVGILIMHWVGCIIRWAGLGEKNRPCPAVHTIQKKLYRQENLQHSDYITNVFTKIPVWHRKATSVIAFLSTDGQLRKMQPKSILIPSQLLTITTANQLGLLLQLAQMH